MSSQNPRNPRPRRRIAGERRPVRPEQSAEPTPVTEPSEPARSTPPAETTPPVERKKPVAPARSVEPTPSAEEPAEEPGEERAPRSAPRWRTVAVLGVVALVLAVVAGVLALGVWRVADVRKEDAVQEARRTAPAAAERAATAILSYDHDKLDADAKTAGRYMTPSYRKQYLSTFDELVRPNATKVKAVVTADVKASAVTQADPDRVSVLLYVNQSTTSTANSGEPQLALNRVQMTMVQRDGRWLVSNITSY